MRYKPSEIALGMLLTYAIVVTMLLVQQVRHNNETTAEIEKCYNAIGEDVLLIEKMRKIIQEDRKLISNLIHDWQPKPQPKIPEPEAKQKDIIRDAFSKATGATFKGADLEGATLNGEEVRP